MSTEGRYLRARVALATLCLGLAVSGCYYGHLAGGQLRMLWARQSIEEVVSDPATPPELARQLGLVGEARRFARELGLDVARQYTDFVPWPGDRVVTTLVATRPGELEPLEFRFPLVGRLPYKGFFDPDRAEREARRLRARGLGVCASAVPAYSTLGWIADPVTGPLLRAARSDGELVEVVVHELVHANVFVADQADFNEGVASYVGEEAAVLFHRERGEAGPAAHEAARVADDRQLARQLLTLRARLAELYEGADAAAPETRRARARLEAAARAEIAALPLVTRDAEQLAQRLELSDACLALRGTYAADQPRHAALHAALGGDLRALVRRLRDAGAREDPVGAYWSGALPLTEPLPGPGH